MRALLPVLCVLALAACSDGKQAGPTTPRNEEAPNALSRTGVCSTSDFQVKFAPKQVVVTSGDQELGHATTTNRDLTGVCRPTQPPGEARALMTGRATRDTSLTCKTERPISINVHPVQTAGDPAVLGSSLVVYTTPPGKPVDIVALAELRRDGTALLTYDDDACSPG